MAPGRPLWSRSLSFPVVSPERHFSRSGTTLFAPENQHRIRSHRLMQQKEAGEENSHEHAGNRNQ